MKVLIDTNFIIDALLGREPFFEHSNKVIQICAAKKAESYIAAHTVTNLFYILRKHFTNDECRDVILSLFDIFEIVAIDKENLVRSLNKKNFKDFEDCLQNECAMESDVDYIITRNTEDFKNSEIVVLTPLDFCEITEDKE